MGCTTANHNFLLKRATNCMTVNGNSNQNAAVQFHLKSAKIRRRYLANAFDYFSMFSKSTDDAMHPYSPFTS